MKNYNFEDYIEEQLWHKRKVFLWGEVNADSVKKAARQILLLDSIDNKEIQLIINSPGGSVYDGMALYDVMQSAKSPISTICMGMALSMGSILLAAGNAGLRKAYAYSRIMIHQPSSGAQGRLADMERQLDEVLKAKKIGAKLLAHHSGQTVEKILTDFDRDHWMSATEAKEYGLIDEVIAEETLEYVK